MKVGDAKTKTRTTTKMTKMTKTPMTTRQETRQLAKALMSQKKPPQKNSQKFAEERDPRHPAKAESQTQTLFVEEFEVRKRKENERGWFREVFEAREFQLKGSLDRRSQTVIKA